MQDGRQKLSAEEDMEKSNAWRPLTRSKPKASGLILLKLLTQSGLCGSNRTLDNCGRDQKTRLTKKGDCLQLSRQSPFFCLC